MHFASLSETRRMINLRPRLAVFLVKFAASCLVAIACCFTPQAFAQPSLLYRWNFDSDTGSAANNTGVGTGGSLTMRNASGTPTDFHGSAGSGPTGLANDIAFNTSSGTVTFASPVALSAVGDIATSTLNKITVTGWLKDTGESNFTDGVSRILTIGPAGYDGTGGSGITQPAPNSGFALNVYNSGTFGALQLKVNGANGAGDGLISPSGILPETQNQWFFFAVTYDSTAQITFDGTIYTNPNPSSPTVAMYIGNAAQSLTAPTFAAAYPGVTGETPSSPGPVQFTSAIASLMNRTGSARNFPYVGFGDDFRIYNSALTVDELNLVRQNLPFRTPGDFTLDGNVTPADIQEMLKALTNLDQFQADHNLSAQDLKTIGDLNGDQFVTNRDIQSLLNLLASAPMGGGAVAVPEPSVFACVFGLFCTFVGFRLARKINFFRFSLLNRAKYLHRL
jgi:hypothetical protein